ncbi:Brp/Blh family beta-carotene 15,15'-dioxygenase [Flavobacterium sp. N1994]|uniref:Brp/Blh family beta-carotene 15,15'-dioxygenase n=1 Tax=Flavobacterium sp. N1994 TaxID=2986827 RepID=UPI002222CB89|nr:Brp/Blh family beta-carotene 15,15'-dioxygenase [Flavobacterium sp. N1994]
MSKIAKISVLLSFLGLWLTSFLKNEYQVIVGFILVLSFGIVHGANDLLIIKKINPKSISILRLLFKYIVLVFVAVLLFGFVPWLAMFLFIIFSSYHFGEQHWENRIIKSNEIIKVLFEINYGGFILLLLFYFHQKEVLDILFSITDIQMRFINIPLLLKINGFILICLGLYNSYKSEIFKNEVIKELLYLIVFGIIFKVANLIWGFTIYFIFWHSIPSLSDQIKYLYKDVTLRNSITYFKSAFLYWIISMFGIGVLYLLLKDTKIFDAIFFSFLAAITFPHVIVIKRMYSENKKTE